MGETSEWLALELKWARKHELTDNEVKKLIRLRKTRGYLYGLVAQEAK